MDEQQSPIDDNLLKLLLQSASDFSNYPGVLNDAAVKDFLDRFPLPLIFHALQTKADVEEGVEATLVGCLERIFKSKYGAHLIPNYMPFVQMGLKAESQGLRCLACKAVAAILDNVDGQPISPPQLIIDNDIYPDLLDCVCTGDEQVAIASIDAIKKLAGSAKGMEVIFPANYNEATHLGNLAASSSSLVRVRLLSLIVNLFTVSTTVASAVYRSNLLGLLEAEVCNTDDILVTLTVLELLYELAEVPHSAEFLSQTTLVRLLSSIISNKSMDPILRSRAMMISGRFLGKENIYMFIDESSARVIISAIDGRLELGIEDLNECESALEALGQIGSLGPGATLLLANSPPAARHVIDAAFDRQICSKQLAALHSLGNISGETRSEGNMILNGDAEEHLRCLIYQKASKSSKLTPSGLFLSLLQQDSEVRFAAYRVIAALVVRQWCLVEICSKQDIINVVTDPTTETTKIGMEARYNCCKVIHKAFVSSSKLSSVASLAGIASKLQEAVSRGPYLIGKTVEAQPVVVTADRF